MKKVFTSLLAILISVCMFADDTPPTDITSDYDPNNILGTYTFLNWGDATTTDGLTGSQPSNATINIYDNYQTNIYLETTSTPAANYQNWYLWFDTNNIGTTIVVRADNYVFGDGMNNVSVTYNISWTDWASWLANTAAGATVISLAKTDDTTIAISIVFHDNNTEVYTLTFTGGYVPSSFKMGGELCTYTIEKIIFTEIDIEVPTEGIIDTDTNFTENDGNGLVITTTSFNAYLTDLIAIKEGMQTNVHLTMTEIGAQYGTFIFETNDGSNWFTCVGNNNIWGTATTGRYPNFNVDPVLDDYTVSVAIVDGVYRVYVKTPEGREDYIWEGVFADNGVSTFYMGGELCTYKITSIDFTSIDVCNTAVSSKTVYTGTISDDRTFDPVINIYGSYGYYNYASPVEFAITEGKTTKVSVTAQPFILDENNFRNFVIETAPTATADAIPLRADALANNVWNNEGVTATITPTLASVEKSWGDDWTSSYINMCKAYTNLSIEATITSDETVVFSVYWLNGETQVGSEIYTVTYSGGVPNDLVFHIGADGSIMTINSVSFSETTTESGEGNTPTAISNVNVPVLEVARYNILGQRIIAPQRGINIIKYSDGSTKKVLVK